MFCPKCKAEYIPGITVCADCDVPLVDKLPEEKELPPKPPYKQLKALFNTAEIAVIKSILDDVKVKSLQADRECRNLAFRLS